MLWSSEFGFGFRLLGAWFISPGYLGFDYSFFVFVGCIMVFLLGDWLGFDLSLILDLRAF